MLDASPVPCSTESGFEFWIFISSEHLGMLVEFIIHFSERRQNRFFNNESSFSKGLNANLDFISFLENVLVNSKSVRGILRSVAGSSVFKIAFKTYYMARVDTAGTYLRFGIWSN